jgi:hypothetical protein
MRSINIFLSVLVITILAACAAPTPAPEVSQAEIDKALNILLTEGALTPADGTVNPPAATSTPALPSVAPTATLLPTQTSYPTSTPFPTITPFVLPSRTPTPIFTAKPKPSITILGVQKNIAVSVEADNFLPDQVLKIRIGPYDTFSTNAVEVGSINSGSSGTVKFSALLPAVVQDVEKLTIRLDGSLGEVAYTTFTNQTSGTVPTVSATVTSSICKLSVSPALGTVMGPGTDFDAVWTVTNISGKTWELYTTDYKYIKGTEMQKFGDAYDLNQVVETGEKVTLTVDMLAPADPGTYSATWALVQGSTIICTLPVKIVVK